MTLTSEQQVAIAERVLQEYEAKLRIVAEGYVYLPWYRRLWRWMTCGH